MRNRKKPTPPLITGTMVYENTNPEAFAAWLAHFRRTGNKINLRLAEDHRATLVPALMPPPTHIVRAI